MSTTGTQRIRDETAKDVTLQHLTRTIVDGWPEVYKDCPADLHPFWNFRDELSVENQLLFKGDRVVIPSTLQPEILKHLHTGHMGTEKMQLRARSSVFWPGLTNDVKNITKSCEPCQKHAPKQRQEEILVHEPTATKPWSKLASDIFDIKGQSYIVIADYYSRFPYVKQLSNITSKSTINVFKPLFADHGFCDILVMDNGPSYVSKEFTTFLEDCSIRHITSSPMYPQSNGFAESMVKVMKNLITKSVESKEDPNWALQAYRATPLSASLPSPAEMLHGRPLRTNIPSSRHQPKTTIRLNPNIVANKVTSNHGVRCGIHHGHYANLCLGGKKPSINTINETDDTSTYLLSLDATCNSITFPKPVVNATQTITTPPSARPRCYHVQPHHTYMAACYGF